MDPVAGIKGINQQLSPIQSLGKGLDSSGESSDSKGISFSSVLGKSLMGAGKIMDVPAAMTDKLITGEVKNPHDVTMAGEKARIMLRLTTTVCSKVAAACTTLFQMQI